MRRPLTMLIHGESGAGKSWLADTAPGPRLILDLEGGTRFTPSRKIHWTSLAAPLQEEPGPDDSVVATVTDLQDMKTAYMWLSQTEHPYRSVVVDSLTEVQKRYVDQIAGAEAMKLQDYGELARKTESMVRNFRDLTMLPRPVDVVVFVTGSRERGQDGAHAVIRPFLIGSAAEQVGYFVDVMTYLTVIVNAQSELERRALFAPLEGIAAKDRTGRLGITMDSPTIPKMLDAVYGPQKEDG